MVLEKTYEHKMDAVNILREFTDCVTFPFSKISAFYDYTAQIHVYLKRAHQVLDNTNIQFELLSNLLHKELYDCFDCLASAFIIMQLLTREALDMM